MVIWISDLVYKDVFVVKGREWRSGRLCFTALYISLLFTILTQYLLVFLSFSRLIVVVNPLKTSLKRTKTVLRYIFIFCTMTIGNTTVFVLPFWLRKDPLPFNLCLPFVDPTGSVFMIRFITWFTVCTQTLSSAAIIIMHVILVRKLNRSKRLLGDISSTKHSNVSVISQLLIITASNILCWFPVNMVYISAMFMTRYPSEMVIWATIICFPVNSIINPIVFCMIGIKKILRQPSMKKYNK